MSTRLSRIAYALLACGLAACAGGDGPSRQRGAGETASHTTAATQPAADCARRAPQRFVAVDAGRSGPVTLMRDAGRSIAIVADADERALHTFDLDGQTQLAVTPLPEEPSHVLGLADGRVAVTMRYDNRVAIFEPEEDGRLAERCSAAVAAEPIAMAERRLPEGGSELVVVSGYGAELALLDSMTLATHMRTELQREPRAVVLSEDGETAFVSHMVGGRLSAVDLHWAPNVRLADLRVGSVFTRGQLDRESVPRAFNQGFALVGLTRDGSHRLFAPGASVDTGDLREPVSSGYGSPSFSSPNVVAPVVVVVDAATEKVLTGGLATHRNDSDLDCLLPRAAAASGDRLWVSCLGVDAVVELDARTAQPAMLEHRRFPVPAGPVGLAVDAEGQRLVVWSQFAKQLSSIDLESGTVSSRTLAHRQTPLLSTQLARGRAIFHSTVDPRVSSDHRACASCHPDGRDDGLVWASPDGKRQTKFLAGQLKDSAPYGWFGEHATLHEHLQGTFANLGGSGFDMPIEGADDDFNALVAYALELPTPTRAQDQPPELLARGKALFEGEAHGCVGCHPGGSTNGLAYDLGSGSSLERKTRFDTPSLRFIASSAPYFHDGRFATLRDLLLAQDVAMGHTETLGDHDLNALETYLRTL